MHLPLDAVHPWPLCIYIRQSMNVFIVNYNNSLHSYIYIIIAKKRYKQMYPGSKYTHN